MKAKLIYFSGTGNTKRITELYRAELSARGYDVEVAALPLERGARLSFDGCDIVGIGYPIHGFNAPKTTLDAIKTVAKRNKASGEPPRVFIYKTSGEPVRMSDVSSLKAIKLLKRRGYAVNSEYHYVMPYNIIFRHGDAAVDKMWTTAKQLVPADADALVDGAPHMPKKLFMGGFLAWILRCEHWGAHIIGKTFKATDDCIHCGKCVKACPVENIRTNKKGKIKFGTKCMLCMRCVQDCPKAAIKMGMLNGWRVTGAYSFEHTDIPDPPSKHDGYCKKAYDRYYADALSRIADHAARRGNALDND